MIGEGLKQYLIKICGVLNSHHVEYLVVGGAAVSHYGFNRPSGIGQFNSNLKADLDFWYNPTAENYHNLVQALDELQVDTTDLKELIFDKKRTFLKIPHEDFHTDFLPIMAGLDSFLSCNSKAEIIDIGGVTLRILSYDDLIANKRTVNRKTDQSDITELSKMRRRRGKGI